MARHNGPKLHLPKGRLAGPDERYAASVPRGKFIGTRDKPVTDESEHFMKCETCGGWLDMRDLGQVFDHEGPLPHPVCDLPQ